MTALTKAARIISGCALVGIILYAAQMAVRDCTSGLFTYDNCLWLWLREQAGLPNNKLLHWLALFIVGLALLGCLYLTIRYVFPRSRTRSIAGSQ